MNKSLLLLFVFVIAFSCKKDKKEESKSIHETTVYYLIRHAEKDRKNLGKDPNLTQIGLERANNWAKIFAQIKLDEIYSTDYKRTLQTALPTSLEKKLEIQSYDPDKMYDQYFQGKTKGKIVLIVGHSDTTPAFVNSILGEQKYDQIDDTDNGKLFIVTIVNNKVSVKIEDHN